MGSDNPSSADDQQETTNATLEPLWVVGLVDGEGCFSVSIHRNPYVRRTRGWQLHPTFQVYQHERHQLVLEVVKRFFGCGRIRSKGPNSRVLTFAVDSLADLDRHVIPFFEQYPLVVKHSDFMAFAQIVRAIRRKEHLTESGFERAVCLAYSMNALGKQRSRSIEDVLAGSSETARQASPAMAVKIQSDPHGDVGSQAEMIWPPAQQAER